MAKFIRVFNHGKGKIEIPSPILSEAIPVELHFKEDGALNNKPSFAMVMTAPILGRIFGQLSLETLQECLNELGYSITKNEQ